MIVGLEDYKKKIKEINSAPIQKSQSLSSNYDFALNIANRAVKREEDKKKQLQTWMKEYENKTYDEMKKISSGDLDPSDPKTEFIKSYTALKGEQEEKEKMLSLDITEETTKINTMVANERKAHEIAKSAINAKNKAHEEARLSGKTDAESKEIANSVDISQYMNQLKELGYNTYDISFELSRAQSDLKKATMLQKVTNYSQNADFEEKAKAVPSTRVKDSFYDIINSKNKNNSSTLAKSSGGKTELAYYHMEDDEIKMYTYLYNTEGKKSADEYFDFIEQDLNFRKGNQIYETLKDTMVAKYAIAPAAGIEDFVEGTIGYFDKERPITSTQYVAYTLREDLGTVEKGAFDILRSAGNMAPSILISYATAGIGSAAGMSAQAAGTASQIAGSASMGLSAAGNAYQNALREGRDRMQARAYGNLVGLSEFGMQYAIGGVSKLGGKALSKWTAKINAIDNAFVRVSTKYAGSVLSEGTEEALQEIIDPIFKTVVFDDKYEPAQIEDIMYTAIVGGITGGIFESGEIISPEISRIKNDSLTRSLLSTEAKNILNDMVKDTAAKAGAGKILNYAIQNEAVGAKVTKQAAFEAMSDSGLSPSSAFEARLKDSAKTELSESGLQKETVSLINGLIDKFDTAFASAWYGSEGISSARGAASVYVKASAAADVVGAAIITSDAVNNESLSENQKKKALRKANTLLPITSKVDIKSGTSKEIADRIMQSANNYLNLIDKSTADVSQNYMADMVSTLNEALENTSGIDSDAKSALVDLLLYGKVDENINTVLADPDVTEFLSRILGTHINSSTKVSDIVRKAKNMLSVYKAGKGLEYNSVSKQKYARAQTILKSLEAAGIKNSKIIQGFLNTVYNGKLTEAHARAIMENEKAFDLFIKTTGANLDVNSTLQDVMDAADLIAGFKLNGEFSQYYNKSVASIVESDTLVPDGEVGIYDADNGRIILNSKATQEQKNAFILAHKILTESSSASDTQFSLSNSFSSEDKIIVDMDENARAKILKKRNVELAEISSDVDNVLENNFEFFNEKYDKTDAQSIIKKIAEYFNVFSGYSNKEFNIEFEFGARNLRKSVHTQKGNYHLYAQMLSNFSTIIENAVGVEVHNRNKEGYKPDETLKNVYVLCSAFRNKTEIVPVKLEIKEFSDKPNRLYVAITLESIKKDRFMATGVPIESDSLRNSPVSISISELFSKINPEDTDFTKYIPDSMLANEQKKVLKEKGLLKSIAKTYDSDFKSNDGDKISFEGKSNFSASLSERILDYVSQNQSTDALADKIAKNFSAYMRADQSRLIGSDLTPENINNEIAADFLTKLFTDPKLMEEFAQNDLDLAVELSERVYDFSETSTDKKLSEYAGSVYKDLYNVISADEFSSELEAVLKERYDKGLSTSAIEASSGEDKVNMEGVADKTFIQKVQGVYNDLKRGLVDSGEAIKRLSDKLGNDSIYHMYNNSKQAKQATNIMLTKWQTDLEGNKIGESLKDIFLPIVKDKKRYKNFCLYMQYLNNSERAVYDKAIFPDISREESLRRAESLAKSNPEFKAWGEKVYKYIDGLLGWQLDSGLISGEQYDSLKATNKYYVPALMVQDMNTDKPFFYENVMISKGVKRAKGGNVQTMPLLEAITLKTTQIVNEAKMNVLANEMINSLKAKGMLVESLDGFDVSDAALQEFIYHVTATRKVQSFGPEKVNGVYTTPAARRKLIRAISELFNFAEGSKENAAALIRDYAQAVTLSETYNRTDAETLVNKLIKIASVPEATADALYYTRPELRKTLKDTKIYVSPDIVNEIPDYSAFAKSAFGRLKLTTKQEAGNIGVDVIYQELSLMHPDIFDPDITNPTDQLMEIHKVATETLKKPASISMTEYYAGDISKLKAELFHEISEASTAAIKAAHAERIDITEKADVEGFEMYNVDSTDNFAFNGEQEGNRMAFYIDGVRHTADIGRGLFEGLKHIDYVPDAKRGFVPFKVANNLFKKLVTSYNPFFSIRNFVRDLQDAVMYSTDARKLLLNLPKAYKEIATGGETWNLYQSLGGVGSSYFDFKGEMDLATSMDIKSRTVKAGQRVVSVFEYINQAVEQAPRLAEFMTVLEKGDGSYASKMKALYAAADVTVNFGRSGICSKFLNSTIVPFYNPAMQGASKFVRMFTETKGAKEWVLLAAKLLALGFASGAINELINYDDEEYEQLTDYQKKSNILIKIGDGRFLKIPKGRSVNVFGITAGNIIDAARGEDVDWIGGLKTSFDQIAPNNPITDNLIMPIVNASNNRTWYGGEIESASDENVAPSQRYDETTDYFSRWLGKSLNYSPKKIHYILDSYTGVVGDYVLPLLTPKGGGDIIERSLLTAGDNFIVDSKASNHISSDYYSLIDELTYEKNDINNTDNTAAAVSLRFLNSQTKALYDFYDELHEINGGDFSPSDKAEKSRELKTTISGLMLNAMDSQKVVYETAQNFKSKYAYKKGDAYYDESGDEITYERYLDIIYREVSKEVFGAEYALQTYNVKVYEDASKAVKDGASFDVYYDAYFGTKNIEGDIDYEKGTIKTGSARKNKWKHIDSMNASQNERAAVAKVLFDISEDKIEQATASGISMYEYIDFVCDTGTYKSDDDHTKKEKVLTYINRMQLSAKQKDTLYLLAGYSEKNIYSTPWR